MALSDTSRQACWICNLFMELGINIGSIPLNGDNQGSIFLASNPAQEHRTKHIDIRHHFIRFCVEDKIVKLYFVESENQLADILTKSLTFDKFWSNWKKLGFAYYPGLSSKPNA